MMRGGMKACMAILAMSLAVSGISQTKTEGPAEPVDLNRASVAELMQVKGMTASWAGRIVRFRPYRSKADLVERGVVSADVYARIRDGVVAHRVGEVKQAGKRKDRSGQDTY